MGLRQAGASAPAEMHDVGGSLVYPYSLQLKNKTYLAARIQPTSEDAA